MTLSLASVKDDYLRKQWLLFPYWLYRNTPQFVPPLKSEQTRYFDPQNPIFRRSEFQLFLALRNGRPAGRICCLVNGAESEKLGFRRGRFGWFETIDDREVSSALLDAAMRWCRQQGCSEMMGPVGLTDLDPCGIVIDGFLELGPANSCFNFPYYQEFLESFGLQKKIDYQEYEIMLREEDPEFVSVLARRYATDEKYRIVQDLSRSSLRNYAASFWRCFEQAYEPLLGVTPLTPLQRKFYEETQFKYLDPRFVLLAVNRSDEVVGFLVLMPNISEGLRKAKGRLFPTGLWHIWRDARRVHTLDFLLAGALPSPDARAVWSMLAMAVVRCSRLSGTNRWLINRQLETNTAVTGHWRRFDSRVFRRLRVFSCSL